MNTFRSRCLRAFVALIVGFSAQSVYAQSECKNRGDLDALFCDEN